MVTSGKQWRKAREEGFEFALPSGKVASIRPVGVELLVRLNRIPEVLMTPLLEGDSEAFDKLVDDRWSDYLGLIDAFCELSFVNPRIVENPQADDEISIEDVELQDKQFVFQFINAPVSQLAAFHQEQKGTVDTVDAKQGRKKSAKRPADDKSVGKSADGDAGLVDSVPA